MTRAGYLRNRCLDRETPRTERGLPHHPDGTGFADCPDCKGTGIHFGYCPTGDDDVPCAACGGNGVIDDGGRDPLDELHEARKVRDLTGYAWKYRAWRKHALRPSLGIRQLHMIEAAIGCGVAMRDLLLATKRKLT